jgi:uncharacterized protein YidB (DUF937 family)
MARGFPSMTALLGLLAIAGYQNRDKIIEVLNGMSKSGTPAGQGGTGGLLEKLRGTLGGASAGSILSGGLGELIDRFKKNGQGDTAESWVKTGPNKSARPRGVGHARETHQHDAGGIACALVPRAAGGRG